MEYNGLPQFVLILLLVGMIIGVGVLTMDKFGNAVLNDASGSDDDVLLWTHNFTAMSQSTITASSASAVNSSNGAAVSLVWNDADKWEASSVRLASNSPASVNGSAINVSYTYGVDSKATDALQASRDEVSNVSTVWLGLIVTISILSIILGMVISSFAKSFKR